MNAHRAIAIYREQRINELLRPYAQAIAAGYQQAIAELEAKYEPPADLSRLCPEVRESILASNERIARLCKYAPNRASVDGDEPDMLGEDVDYLAFLEKADAEHDAARLEGLRWFRGMSS